jgi:hypothetical protein
MNKYAQSVCALNDAFRTTLTGGAVLVTAGIVALGPEVQAAIIAAVCGFTDFNADNDPWGEHDFGAVVVAGVRVYFKIDYFDRTRAAHSPDPADPTQTERVMTIMLADEY